MRSSPNNDIFRLFVLHAVSCRQYPLWSNQGSTAKLTTVLLEKGLPRIVTSFCFLASDNPCNRTFTASACRRSKSIE